jgi:glycosyltransferase involved in cell wall biosynthesis
VPAPDGTLDVLVVSSWFPAYDDPAAGRFVADQVEALDATGKVFVRVITFDPARLTGGSVSRQRQADAILSASVAAIGSAEPLFIAPAWGIDGRLPVGRLSIPDGTTAAAGAEHAAIHRERALLALADRLTAADRLSSPGIVHAHTVYPDGAAAASLAERLGWPLLVTEHSSFVDQIIAHPGRRSRYERTLAAAHGVMAVSATLAGELQARFPEHAAKITIMPNAVPLAQFQPAPADARVADQLVFVGRRKETKGIEVLLAATAIAQATRPSITLRLLGRAPDDATEARWRSLSRELGIEDVVAFEDAVDRGTIAAALAGASLFVHPSPRETFGVVAVEALASGTPVVATDSGGVTEIMGPEPDRVGAVVEPHDPLALAAAIIATLDRRATFDPFALRASVERRFGAEYVAERLLVAYRRAAADSRTNRTTRAQVAGPRAAARPPAQATGGRTIVVALDREQAVRRLAPLPEPLRAEIVLVTARSTARGAASAVAAIGIGRVVEVDVGSRAPSEGGAGLGRRRRGGRLARLFVDPVESVRRVLGRGVGSAHWAAPATIALAALAGERGADDTGISEIVAVDGHDQLAATPVVRSGRAAASAGGLRRLADRWLGDRPSPDESRA